MVWNNIPSQLAKENKKFIYGTEENLQSKSLKTFIQKNPDLQVIRLSTKAHILQGWVECISLFAFRKEFIRMKNE